MNLNTEALKHVASSNPTAKVIFSALQDRRRLRHFLDLQRFKTTLVRSGMKIVDKEYSETFKKLQDMGAGSIVFGRKGNPDRFEWHYSLADIGKFAMGQAVDIKKLGAKVVKLKPKATKSMEKEAEKSTGETVKLGQKVIFIPIRKNMDVEIVIPNDINADEVEFIVSSLKRASRSA